ncbi:uncharacterized protein TNCV_1121351 [Trichonephila clavipes]|uniref:Uncharacterized protein n=1 Tax=Trichonephila clavipes TaxID=2585209 RepID=A0A8X6T5U4_TRICX|nr:uncharacterized protein TNCV_1121351 [Trichonephila clavipes]
MHEGRKMYRKVSKGTFKGTKTNDKGCALYRHRAPEDGGHTFAKMMHLQKHYFMLTYTWNVSLKEWKRRVQGTHVNGWPGVKAGGALGRICTVHVSNFECYCLRMLMNVIQGPTNFLDLKTVDGQELETFRQVCEKLGLLEDDNH